MVLGNGRVCVQDARRYPGDSTADRLHGFYVLSVFPGSDYVYHYGRMVRQAMEVLKTGSSSVLLEIRRFPVVEARTAEWTGLDQVHACSSSSMAAYSSTPCTLI